jgi:hypothetical protein
VTELVVLTPEQLKTIIADAYAAGAAKVQTNEGDRYLTPDDAAEYVGCTTRTLANYRKAGLAVHRARGGKPRYLKSDLDRFLEGR